jgi:hypothetical protein
MRQTHPSPRLRNPLIVAALALGVGGEQVWSRYQHCLARAASYQWASDFYQRRHVLVRGDVRSMRREIQGFRVIWDDLLHGRPVPEEIAIMGLVEFDGLIQMWERELIMREHEADYLRVYSGSYRQMALRFRQVAASPWLQVPAENDPPPFE